MPDNPRSRARPASGTLRLPKNADPRKAAIVAMVRSRGLTPRSAALACSVASSTFYEMIDGDPTFRDDLEIAGGRFEAAIVGSILKDAVSLKSWRAKVAILQARYPHWNPTTKVDVSVDDGRRLDDDLTDAELNERMDAIQRESFRRMDAEQLEGWAAEIGELLAEKARQ